MEQSTCIHTHRHTQELKVEWSICVHTHTIHTHTHKNHTDRVDFNSTCSYISAPFKTENPLHRFPNPSLTAVAHPSHQMRKQAVDFRNHRVRLSGWNGDDQSLPGV